MDPWYVSAVLALHLLGATIWIGGSVALGVVAVALRAEDPSEEAAASLRTARVARALAWVLWPALLVTILSGVYNLSWFLPPGTALIATPAGPWFVAKFLAVAIVLAAAGTHTFILAPRLRRARDRGAPEASLAGAKRWSFRLAILSMVASVFVLVLAVGAVGAGP